MAQSPWIIEPTEATFQQEVLEKSVETPVVVDFWAPWCGPCRQLAPLLEQLVEEFGGRFLLAKVNTDAEPGLAAAFQVQSIPMVVAVRDRQLVDVFQGALPEQALRDWLARVLPTAAEESLAQAAALEASEPEAAAGQYEAILADDAENALALMGLTRVRIAQQRWDDAGAALSKLEARGFLEPEAERIKSLLHVRQTASESGGASALRTQAQSQPNDLALQVKLAEALAAEGETREALEACLAVIHRDRAGVGQQAKGAMLDILKTVDDAELASEYRRRLASAIY